MSRSPLAGLLLGAAAALVPAALPAQRASLPNMPPAIASAEYAQRRDALAAKIDSGIVIGFGERTPVTDFGPFFQLPAFHYLTGFDEADAAFVMVVRFGKGTTTLFLTPIAPRTALYYGFRPDSARAFELYGIRARSAAALKPFVDSVLATGLPVYHLGDFGSADFAAQDSLTRGGQFIKALQRDRPGLQVRNAHSLVNPLRARKSDAEVALLRKAAEISSAGHRAVMAAPQPKFEYEWRAVLEGTFFRMGAERVAYGSIVGSGERGTLLHYMKASGPTAPGELVTMDAGAQYQGYTSDITRTIPVNGVFTPAQKAFYQVVLDAQKAAEKAAVLGGSTRASVDSSIEVRARGLVKLGLIDSVNAMYDCNDRQPLSCRQATFWGIHGITHGVGLAVHDPMQGTPNDPVFKAGDVFTIEPGLYVSEGMVSTLPDTPNNRAWIARFRPAMAKYTNMGVRIEDTYWMSEKGLVRLSEVPREIADIERAMRKTPARRGNP